jgi:hypothetical protein
MHLAAAAAVAALRLPVAQASSPATLPGLVYTPGCGNSIVARYDPLSLARSGPRLLAAALTAYGFDGRHR